MRMTRCVLASLVAVMSLAGPPSALAKFLSLEVRCPCTRPSRQWVGHAAYVRCVKRNALHYLRIEAHFDRVRGGPPRSRAELRAAARARVAEASASRCGYESYRCDLGTRPCPSGETCDARTCDLTAGVCVPTPAACPTDGAPRCTCVSKTDPFGLAYANDCERLRAGAVLDVFRNPPFQTCEPSCGGPDQLACAPPRTCVYPWGACSTLTQHGRCVEAREACPGPVCGCDGVTYGTECDADRAGVLVAYGGTCGTQCGGPPSFACPPGLECQKEWGTCEQPDTWGLCRDVACLPLGEVCGCDGQLYPRPCDARPRGHAGSGLSGGRRVPEAVSGRRPRPPNMLLRFVG